MLIWSAGRHSCSETRSTTVGWGGGGCNGRATVWGDAACYDVGPDGVYGDTAAAAAAAAVAECPTLSPPTPIHQNTRAPPVNWCNRRATVRGQRTALTGGGQMNVVNIRHVGCWCGLYERSRRYIGDLLSFVRAQLTGKVIVWETAETQSLQCTHRVYFLMLPG